MIKLIKAFRRKKHMTQLELAGLVGQHQSLIARLESGARGIEVIELIKLAELIGFSPEHVVRKIKRIH